MFGNDRQAIRQFFTACRQKQRNGQPLEPLERLVAHIIAEHPEYHSLLDSNHQGLDRDYPPEQGESNPFLHMGMHITLGEQLTADRPAGIRKIYQTLLFENANDPHRTEHRMMECLGLILWEAQRDNRHPDEILYLQCLGNLIKDGKQRA